MAAPSFVWDVSALTAQQTDYLPEFRSASFSLAGVENCNLEFCPRGTHAVRHNATLGFRAPLGWAIRLSLFVDGIEKVIDETKYFNDDEDGAFVLEIFDLVSQYTEVGVRILSAESPVFVWDTSAFCVRDARRNDEWKSGTFSVGGILGCRLEFCPQGTSVVRDYCTLSFFAPPGWVIRTLLWVNETEKVLFTEFDDTTPFIFEVFELARTYFQVGVRVLSAHRSRPSIVAIG